MPNQVETVQLSKGAQFQVDLVKQVDKATQEMGQKFTDYGKQCVINAIANLMTTCRNNDINFGAIDQTMLKIALQNVGYTELNFNAQPAEAYFDLRKTSITKDGKTISGYSIAIRPQGAGNEKLTRLFGVNLDELKTCILVREGDEYTLPGFDGEKMTPFKWTSKSLNAKVIMVVYPLKKKDGTYEYLIGTREGIKPNLIAQIRQNTLYSFKKEGSRYEVDTTKRDEFYEKVNREFESLTVDQILADPYWRNYLTPTYTSGGSQEAMIIRKMKNNALKQYPREFDNSAVKAAVEDMYEDKDDSLIKRDDAIDNDVDPVERVEEEIKEETTKDAVQDFEVEEKDTEPKGIEPPVNKAKDNYDEEL